MNKECITHLHAVTCQSNMSLVDLHTNNFKFNLKHFIRINNYKDKNALGNMFIK